MLYKAGVHAKATPEIIDPALLMLAYRSGIFPMSDSRDDPEIFWVEPRNRAILPLDGFHLSHSLAKTLRRDRFTVTCNQAFTAVMNACAAPRLSHGEDPAEGAGSWISHRIAASYQKLHELGHAHSIECWQADDNGKSELVGGLYGVGFDRVFCGESMFSRVTDSSKIALAWLVAALRCAGAKLLDCQFMTAHLASLGAVEITQQRYVELLTMAQMRQFEGGWVACAEFEAEGSGDGAAVAAAVGLPEGFAALLARAEGLSSSPGNFIAQSLTQTS